MGNQVNQKQSWWQKHRTLLIIIAVVFIIFAVVTIIILLGLQFGWDWTGFVKPSQNSNFAKVTIKSTTKDIEQPATKTLWDWLQLLFVPIVLAIAGFWLNHLQRSRESTITERQKEIDQAIATDFDVAESIRRTIDELSSNSKSTSNDTNEGEQRLWQ